MGDKRPSMAGPAGLMRVLRPVGAPSDILSHEVVEEEFVGARTGLVKVDRAMYAGALLDVTCTDGITLSVHRKQPSKDDDSLLMAATGTAVGRVALAASRNVTRLDVRAQGEWSIRVMPPSRARRLTGPDKGDGPDVLVYEGPPRTVRLRRQGRRKFELRALAASLEPAIIFLTVKGDTDQNIHLPGPCVLALMGEGTWSLA